ncbi:MAG: hypothetical protein R3242_11145 [Akkermansiaceae bacterium]|nr:hypothetical protein [Akkermansiaceae bacterium]
MKLASGIPLLCAITTFGMTACSPTPEESVEPVAGAEAAQSPGDDGAEVVRDDGNGNEDSPTVQNGVDVNRLRLPDMEKLPSENELASKEKPDKTGGGVIARPPSEE